jgi:hypothetical protein
MQKQKRVKKYLKRFFSLIKLGGLFLFIYVSLKILFNNLPVTLFISNYENYIFLFIGIIFLSGLYYLIEIVYLITNEELFLSEIGYILVFLFFATLFFIIRSFLTKNIFLIYYLIIILILFLIAIAVHYFNKTKKTLIVFNSDNPTKAYLVLFLLFFFLTLSSYIFKNNFSQIYLFRFFIFSNSLFTAFCLTKYLNIDIK